MLKANGSNVSRDVFFAYSEVVYILICKPFLKMIFVQVNFGLRLQINLYEKHLVQFGKFADERKSKQRIIAAGVYNDFKFSHTSNFFIFPNPKDAMTVVLDRSVEKFKDRFDLADLGFANDVCRYALGELFFLSFLLFDCLFIARIQRRLPSTRGIGGLDDSVW